jgi:hypothetical protein
LDLAGKTFDRLTVIERVKVPGANNAMWRCKCSCGGEVVAAAGNIGRTTRSCGCLQIETVRRVMTGNTSRRTHNRTGTPEYQAWTKLKLRCYDPNNEKYPHYGARGITVCDAWRDSFEAFFADMGEKPSPKHSIDRKDVNGNYEKDNCHWANAIQQMRNTTRNNFVTIGDETKCMAEWCDILQISRSKPYELCRGTRADRKGPPRFTSPEDALRHLHATSSAG